MSKLTNQTPATFMVRELCVVAPVGWTATGSE